MAEQQAWSTKNDSGERPSRRVTVDNVERTGECVSERKLMGRPNNSM